MEPKPHPKLNPLTCPQRPQISAVVFMFEPLDFLLKPFWSLLTCRTDLGPLHTATSVSAGKASPSKKDHVISSSILCRPRLLYLAKHLVWKSSGFFSLSLSVQTIKLFDVQGGHAVLFRQPLIRTTPVIFFLSESSALSQYETLCCISTVKVMSRARAYQFAVNVEPLKMDQANQNIVFRHFYLHRFDIFESQYVWFSNSVLSFVLIQALWALTMWSRAPAPLCPSPPPNPFAPERSRRCNLNIHTSTNVPF